MSSAHLDASCTSYSCDGNHSIYNRDIHILGKIRSHIDSISQDAIIIKSVDEGSSDSLAAAIIIKSVVEGRTDSLPQLQTIMYTDINPAELFKKPPPQFGHSALQLFGFDPEYVNLNHGSYGSLSNPVLHACNTLSARIEANPDLFMRMHCVGLLGDTRERLAQFIGAEDKDECVLVPNASSGLNTVLKNFEWEKHDTIVVLNTTYGSIQKTAHYISDLPPHPSISAFTIEFPTTHADILERFEAHIGSLVDTSPTSPDGGSVKSDRKIVAIIDSIISNPGILLPWKEMVGICKKYGVWTVIDAAHSVGQEPGLNLRETKPDFWVSNCHKWLYAKRGCAVLYVPKRNQHIIKSTFPTPPVYVSPSTGLPSPFVEQFDWNGTIDFAPYLSVNTALDFRSWLGGEEKINEYCHSLALKGGKRLSEILGTPLMDPEGTMSLSMVNVELPLPANPNFTPNAISPKSGLSIDMTFRTKLLLEHRMYSAHFYHNGRWWTRCSAQIFNELEDFEKLGKAFLTVCREIVEDLEPNFVSA